MARAVTRRGTRSPSTWSLRLACEFFPQLVLVSAGSDTHAEERLPTTMFSDSGFATMDGTVRRLAAELEVAVGGGCYALNALAPAWWARWRC
jgi:acetoin utilization deacetylase AcuC-like enzyme